MNGQTYAAVRIEELKEQIRKLEYYDYWCMHHALVYKEDEKAIIEALEKLGFKDIEVNWNMCDAYDENRAYHKPDFNYHFNLEANFKRYKGNGDKIQRKIEDMSKQLEDMIGYRLLINPYQLLSNGLTDENKIHIQLIKVGEYKNAVHYNWA